jgi:hypothetical protein
VDKGAKRAWIIEHGQSLDLESLKTRVWQTVCELADIPLLQHWREPILRQIWDSMVSRWEIQPRPECRRRRRRPSVLQALGAGTGLPGAPG